MKTIEILSNGRQVQFTTKAITISGREYLYSHISELRHSEAKRVYGFKCDGEVVMLPYEEKDTQVLKIIFSQIRQMHRRPAPAAVPVPEVPAAAPAVKEVPASVETPVPEVPAPAAEIPVPAEEVPVPIETPVAEAPVPAEEVLTPIEDIPVPEETPAEEVPAEVPAEEAAETPAEEAAEEAPALSEKERLKEQKRLEKEQRKADKEAARREKQARRSGGSTGAADPTESAAQDIDPEQKTARFKKAIIIFAIILAVFVLLGVAYYFFIGPSSDPLIGPGTTDQTQYNDIDDMINDLEN